MMGSIAGALIAVSLFGMNPEVSQSANAWENDYGRALATTRKAQRPLLIVLDEPQNEQRRIEPVRLVLEASSEQQASLLTPYELCHVDVSTDYGQKVAKAFKAQTLPYTAIIDRTGRKIIFQQAGQLTDREWKDALTSHKAGEIPTRASMTGYSVLQQHGYASSTYCPSCQRGW